MQIFNNWRIGYFLKNWIKTNQNLLLLRSRLKKEIPKQHLKEFYKTWVKNHIGVRRRQIETATDKLFPLTIKISPTMRCNLECKGCFAGNYPIQKDLSLSTLERIVAQAKSLGIPSIGIIGGEPLLVPDIFELFERFRDVGFYLVTNGTLMTDEVVGHLQNMPHIFTIFSIEGFEKTNDYLRGSGVFRKIISAMKKMKAAKLIFGFSTVVHRENSEEVISGDYLDFMIENGCYVGNFLPYIPVGSFPRYHVVCTEEETRRYFDRLNRIANSKPLLLFKEGYSDGTFLNQGCGAGQTINIT
ncbi:MAG: radical SAM protein, partial [Candidatus Aminicenantes bacterium]